jgi:hypothetical protein
VRRRTAYVAGMGLKGGGKFEGHGVDVEVNAKMTKGVCCNR